MNKKELLEEFSRDWEKYYDLPVFRENGFKRKKCESCGSYFWTCDPERRVCGDCEDYSFIGYKLKDWDYIQTWKAYANFFKSKGHEEVKRYPSVCKWIPNLNFTIASIVDFQRIENNQVVFEFPYENLVVPQFCLRFNDVSNVGVTGRHFTGFMMPGQHSYGGYWINKCIELNLEFLTKVLGINKKNITYSESIWAMPDFSVYGPAMETFANGLELVTNVFMAFKTVNGERKELEKKVIDVGWGLERLLWFVNGSPTAYEPTFNYIINDLKEKVEYDEDFFKKYAVISGRLNLEENKDYEGTLKKIAGELGGSVEVLKEKIEPVQALYAVCDHSRSLLFAISDGMLPSNTGGGYNLRMILRRSLALINKHKLGVSLGELIEKHAEYFKQLFPELLENIEDVKKIIKYEEEKYYESLGKAEKTVKNMLAEKQSFSLEELKKLYEEKGITPELVREVAARTGKEARIPDDAEFYAFLEKTRKVEKKEEKKEFIDVSSFPDTKPLWHEKITEFQAFVLGVVQQDGRKFVVLDQTAFYPEMGGQDHDTGFISNVKVNRVLKVGNVVLHDVGNAEVVFQKGTMVTCRIDEERRNQLTKHHTATHIINGAARRVLGNHVWQAGAEKRVDKARLDITHYKLLTEEETREIERVANEVIRQGLPVNKYLLPRTEAEAKYGFRLYQGGAVPSKMIRVVEIPGFDVEACGGTHCDNTNEVEEVMILRTRKIQDGVVRIEFVAGKKLIEETKKKMMEEEFEKKKAIGAKILALNKDADLRDKTLEELEEMLRHELKKKEKEEKEKAKSIEGTGLLFCPDASMKAMQEAGRRLIKEKPEEFVIIIGNGVVYGARGEECPVDIEPLVMKAAEIIGGKAGTTPSLKGKEFKGGGPLKENSEKAFEELKKMIG